MAEVMENKSLMSPEMQSRPTHNIEVNPDNENAPDIIDE